MGSSVEPMTKEQKQIYQSMVDEAYEQFTEIVAEGRNMSLSKVKKLADGRIYTAKQAKKNGLIDKIGTFEETVSDMKKTYKLQGCSVEDFQADAVTDWTSLLGIAAHAKNSNPGTAVDTQTIQDLLNMNRKFEFSYLLPG